MTLIAITEPYFWQGEGAAIVALLESERFSRVHLRKPGCAEADMRRLLDEIPPQLRRHLSLHDCFNLAEEYGVGGVHLNSRNGEAPEGWSGLVSRSLHSLDEIDGMECDYAFISPVFPSISKQGYTPRFTLDDIKPRLTPKIYALGGVTPARVPELEAAGFAGCAMLGAAWRHGVDHDVFRLHLITNGTVIDEIVASAEKAVAGGCRWVQVRMKDAPLDQVMEVVTRLAPQRESHGITLLVDDHVELAATMPELDGVHVGHNDMPVAEARALLGPGKILGATANTFADLKAAATAGADYIGLGPFRFTTTKKNLSPVLGVDGYREILSCCRREGITLPVVAIGGITVDDLGDILSTGVAGVAISGAILTSPDPALAATQFLNNFNNFKTLNQ